MTDRWSKALFLLVLGVVVVVMVVNVIHAEQRQANEFVRCSESGQTCTP